MAKDNSEPDLIDYLTRNRGWRVITNLTTKPKTETKNSEIKELVEKLQQTRRNKDENATPDDTPEAA